MILRQVLTWFRYCLGSIAAVGVLSTVVVASPLVMTLDGQFADNSGLIQGVRSVTVRLSQTPDLPNSDLGTQVWSDVFSHVVFNDGFMSLELGLSPTNPLQKSFFELTDLYFLITVDGATGTVAVPLRHVPYSAVAELARGVSRVSADVIEGTLPSASLVGSYPGVNGVGPLTVPLVMESGLMVDSTTMVVDVTENRVGILTDTPQYALDVQGDIRVSGVLVFADGSTMNMSPSASILSSVLVNNDSLRFEADADQNFSGDLLFQVGNVTRLMVQNDGKVGIGNILPTQELDVNGGIRIRNTTIQNPGTIRFDGVRFEGFDGAVWRALDSTSTSGGGWQNHVGLDLIYPVQYLSTKVGIGTSRPSVALEVVGEVSANRIRGSFVGDGSGLTNLSPDQLGSVVTLSQGGTGVSDFTHQGLTVVDLAAEQMVAYPLIPTGSVLIGDGSGVPTMSVLMAQSGVTVSHVLGQIVFSHADTSTMSSMTLSQGQVFQSIEVDSFGHLVSANWVDFDDRYLTRSSADVLIAETGVQTTFNSSLVFQGVTVDITTAFSGDDIVVMPLDGRIGLGVDAPLEMVDVGGAIRLGTTTSSNSGTIRFNPSSLRFEGYDGSAWKPLDVQATSAGGWTLTGSTLRPDQVSYQVAIGQVTPNAALDVSGDVRLLGDVAVGGDVVVTGGVRIGTSSDTVSGMIRFNPSSLRFEGFDGASWKALDVQSTSAGGWTLVGSALIPDQGLYQVGIGGVDPTKMLDVSGDVRLRDMLWVGGDAVVTGSIWLGNHVIDEGSVTGDWQWNEGALSNIGALGVGVTSVGPGIKLQVLEGDVLIGGMEAVHDGTSSADVYIEGNLVVDGTIISSESTGEVSELRSTGESTFATITGNVGIGVVDPTEKLDVSGDVRLRDTLWVGGDAVVTGSIWLGNHVIDEGSVTGDWQWNEGALSNIGALGVGVTSVASGIKLQVLEGDVLIGGIEAVHDGTSSADVYIEGNLVVDGTIISSESTGEVSELRSTGESTFATITGNVGIGVVDPTEKLDVSGDVRLRDTLWVGGDAVVTGSIWLGNHVIDEGSVTGDWQWNEGALSNIGALGVGVTSFASGIKLQVLEGDVLIGGMDAIHDGTSSADVYIEGNLVVDGTIISSESTGEVSELRSTGESTFATITGNVGIGVVDPTEKLDVSGDVRLRDMLWVGGDAVVTGSIRLGNHVINEGVIQGDWQFNQAEISDIGRMGIGVLSPDYELSVDGMGWISGDLDVGGDVVVTGTVQLGNHVIDEGVVTGDWQWNEGALSNIGALGVGVTSFASGIKLQVLEGDVLIGGMEAIHDGTSSADVYIEGNLVVDGAIISSESTGEVSELRSTGESTFATITGNVGIGVVDPTEKLDVSGDVRLRDTLWVGGDVGVTGSIRLGRYLEMVSGSLMTVTRSGAIEYTGEGLFYTDDYVRHEVANREGNQVLRNKTLSSSLIDTVQVSGNWVTVGALTIGDGEDDIRLDAGSGSLWVSANSWDIGASGAARFQTVQVDGTSALNGDVSVVGVVTATQFVGDGSLLTGIEGGATSLWSQSGTAAFFVSGNVGIGTTMPVAALHVSTENGVLFEGTYGSGSIPVEGGGVRAMWYPAKAAFRVGRVTGIGVEWNDSNIGLASVGMGLNSLASGETSVVAGGADNEASNDRATVVGGSGNVASGLESTVVGGINNVASGSQSYVGAGYNNQAQAQQSTIAGGVGNLVSGSGAYVGGGQSNAASASKAVVSGGSTNTASGTQSTVGGGYGNLASATRATVSGGSSNTALSQYSTVAGGRDNMAEGRYAASGGGRQNVLRSAEGSTISGGFYNEVTQNYSAISGGYFNRIDGAYNSVGGGQNNVVTGLYSTIPGGYSNKIESDYGFAAGNGAEIGTNGSGSFVWSDASGTGVVATQNNQFLVRASGGIWFGSTSDAPAVASTHLIDTSSGAYLSQTGMWMDNSDRNLKENFVPIDPQTILDRVLQLEITSWNFKIEPSVTHVGPMAQDFYQLFGVGADDRHIGSIDGLGVSLLSIQGVYRVVEDQKKTIEVLEDRLMRLEARLKRLEAK